MRKLTKREKQSKKALRRKTLRRFYRNSVIGFTVVSALGFGVCWMLEKYWPESFPISSEIAAARDEAISKICLSNNWVVRQVSINGRKNTPIESIRANLEFAKGHPILLVSVEDVKARMESLPWVKEAGVRRDFSGNITIELKERSPIAFWQKNGEVNLIGDDGMVISGAKLDKFDYLPVVAGDGAPARAYDLMLALSSEPEMFRRVAGMTFIGGRRWNIKFDNGLEVKMPDSDLRDAWRLLAEMQKEKDILERDIISIDMRLPGRLYIRTPGMRDKPLDKQRQGQST